jgi:hypothetical protein
MSGRGPAFRSAERTFQLISQVAGRTGRGEAAGRRGGVELVVDVRAISPL